MDASTVIFLRDAWLLMDSLAQVDAKGFRAGVIGEASPVSANGGFAATSLTITIQVP